MKVIILHIPDIEDLYSARKLLKSVITETPLLNSPYLDTVLDAKIFIKPEMLQYTGAFKFRGAYNTLARLDEKQYPGGVVACSSGNHAQGVAEAARLCGMKATIVMPDDAPEIKVKRTQRSGAEVVSYDRNNEDRDEIAGNLCEQKNAAFVHPYNNPFVIAGQGTAGLEIAESLKQRDLMPDMVLTPCSGGGLTAGVALAIKNAWPSCELYTVEPEGFDDYARSVQNNELLRNEKLSGSICDALLTPTPGELGFEINRTRLAGGLSVTDDEVCKAMSFAFNELKLVVEPGGAVTLAAILSGKINVSGKTVVIVLSGGNVDKNLHAECLKRAGS